MTSPVPVTPSSPPGDFPCRRQSLDRSRRLALAAAAAGIVVGRLGTSTVSQVELANALYTEQGAGFGVMSRAQLEVAVPGPPVCCAARRW